MIRSSPARAPRRVRRAARAAALALSLAIASACSDAPRAPQSDAGIPPEVTQFADDWPLPGRLCPEVV